MSVVETPSKATANALSTMDINTPKKALAEPTLLAKLKSAGEDKVTKPVVVEEKKEDVEEYRKRFVGDLDCEEKDEPLLQESNARFVLFPIKYREVSYRMLLGGDTADSPDLADVQAGSGFVSSFISHCLCSPLTTRFWTSEEINLAPDLHDWDNKLNDNERYFIEHVLAFFAAVSLTFNNVLDPH